MAKKTKTTIQPIVDSYAASIARRADLRAKERKNEAVISEATTAILRHAQANGGERVAFTAKNGTTLVVNPDYRSIWQNPIETIQPGALRTPEAPPPASAAVADQIAALLREGKTAEAGTLLHQIAEGAMSKPAQTQAQNLPKTATQIDLETNSIRTDYWRGLDARVFAYQDAMRNGFLPKFMFYGADRSPFADVSTMIAVTRRPQIAQSSYKSATCGVISLSHEAKKLFMAERDAIHNAIASRDYNAHGKAVSEKRGHVARYISQLEQRVNELQAQVDGAYANKA